MQKTVVLNIAGLTPSLIGDNTPFLAEWTAAAQKAAVKPVVPAVTCTAQATYLTGKWPEEHGIVGNGWYFKEECEVKFWRQSNKLVQAPKVWDLAKAANPDFTCASMFWWLNMYSSADQVVTPRPQYMADGQAVPDFYTQPAALHDILQKKLGTFPLFDFWGPKTSIKSSAWIAEASKINDDLHNPTLTLIYLPHLHYNLQRLGPGNPAIAQDLQEIDAVCADLVMFYEERGAQVILLSEFGVTDVSQPVHLNRVLRENDYLSVREENGLELLDAGVSKAFAVADHQVAHVYLQDKKQLAAVRQLLRQVPGVQEVLAGEERSKYHQGHSRCGDLLVVADADSWFTYYYWFDDKKAPNFARTVDIHKKPGFDPVELFYDPKIRFLFPVMAGKFLKKKLGFRTLLNVIPLDASLIKGSHGRIPERKTQWPVFFTRNPNIQLPAELQAIDVHDLILQHLQLTDEEPRPQPQKLQQLEQVVDEEV